MAYIESQRQTHLPEVGCLQSSKDLIWRFALRAERRDHVSFSLEERETMSVCHFRNERSCQFLSFSLQKGEIMSIFPVRKERPRQFLPEEKRDHVSMSLENGEIMSPSPLRKERSCHSMSLVSAFMKESSCLRLTSQ